MKLYDFKCESIIPICEVIESFDGSMSELKCDGITKSFSKAKKEKLKQLNELQRQLTRNIKDIESLQESDVFDRGVF